jgi:hypothetical protein
MVLGVLPSFLCLLEVGEPVAALGAVLGEMEVILLLHHPDFLLGLLHQGFSSCLYSRPV